MELILSVGKIKQQSTDPNTRTRSDQTALIKADPRTSAQHRFVAVGPYLWTPGTDIIHIYQYNVLSLMTNLSRLQ